MYSTYWWQSWICVVGAFQFPDLLHLRVPIENYIGKILLTLTLVNLKGVRRT